MIEQSKRRLGWTLAAMAMIGCAATGAQALDKVRVGKPEASGFVFAGADIGAEVGIFKKYGIEIETISFAGGPKMHQAVAAKSVDIALGSGPEMALIAKGTPERGVAAMAGPPLSIVLLVRADSDFKTIDDLKGKTIAVSGQGSLTYWLAGELARRKGWGHDGMQRVSLGSMTGMVAGLLAKNVDSIVGNTEMGYRLQDEGKVRFVGRFGEIITDFITHVIFASEELVATNPDLIRRFLRGWFETVKFMHDNPEVTTKIASRVTGISPKFIGDIYREQMPMLLLDGHFDKSGVEVLKQSWIDLKILPEKPLNSKLYTEDFLPH